MFSLRTQSAVQYRSCQRRTHRLETRGTRSHCEEAWKRCRVEASARCFSSRSSRSTRPARGWQHRTCGRRPVRCGALADVTPSRPLPTSRLSATVATVVTWRPMVGQRARVWRKPASCHQRELTFPEMPLPRIGHVASVDFLREKSKADFLCLCAQSSSLSAGWRSAVLQRRHRLTLRWRH